MGRKKIRRYRKGTVYVNFMQKTLSDMRGKCCMTYRDISNETGIPLMTVWELGNDGAKNRCAPTYWRNFERLRILADMKLGLRHRLRAYDTPRKAKVASRRLRKRTIYMSKDNVIEDLDLTDRTQLKQVRTAFNEFCNRCQDDEGYMFVYSTDTEERILENLKKKIQEEMARDKTWITKAPDIILLFAKASGILSDLEDADEEEPDEDEDELEPEEDEDDETAELEDGDVDDGEDAVDPDTEDDEPVESLESDDDGEDDGVPVYVFEMPSQATAGALSMVLQELCNALNSDAQRIEITLPTKSIKPVAIPTVYTASMDVEKLKKRMKVGGDLLNRKKRIDFIKENSVPYKGDLNKMAPKELYDVVVRWAESL